MSYDLGLYYPNKTPARIDSHEDGGTYRCGGSDEATLNITYNYSRHYYDTLDPEHGLRWLYGKTGRETVGRLREAVATLGTERHTGPNSVPDSNLLFRALFDKTPLPEGFAEFSDRCKEAGDLDAPENAALLAEGRAKGWVRDGGSYWKATPGNAGYALSVLLRWAEQHPDAVWDGD